MALGPIIFSTRPRVARWYGKKGNVRDQSEIGKQVDVLELRREVLRFEKETTGLSKMWRRLYFPKTKKTPRRAFCGAKADPCPAPGRHRYDRGRRRS